LGATGNPIWPYEINKFAIPAFPEREGPRALQMEFLHQRMIHLGMRLQAILTG
jgi:hypothetical protein